jgi:hypothetical protein
VVKTKPTTQQLHDFLQNVQHSFEYFDSAGSGLLSMDDIANALAHAGGAIGPGREMGAKGGEGFGWTFGRQGTEIDRSAYQAETCCC